MNILILGGNGFIGSEIARIAHLEDNQVTCVGRNIQASQSRLPEIKWISQSIERLNSTAKWKTFIEGYDVIINCAGSLQKSSHDDVIGVQEKSMIALYEAIKTKPKLHIVQISTNTMAGTNAGDTEFLKTKMNADMALASSDISHTILRPALVIGRNAYGGSALLRAVSSFPFVVPNSFPNASCQITNLSELAAISIKAASGEYGSSGDFSVSSKDTITLSALTLKLRSWLGFSKAPLVSIPKPIVSISSKLADIAGSLGWRAPMRTTAITILNNDVTVDASKPLIETASIDKILTQYSASVQDKWFARLYLLKPVLILALSFFWLASGIIALFNLEVAQAYLAPMAIDPSIEKSLIVITAIADCILGLAILFRKYAKLAMIGMCLLSLGYLASATLFIPTLWLDPIGPLVKVIPSIFLALAGLVILEER